MRAMSRGALLLSFLLTIAAACVKPEPYDPGIDATVDAGDASGDGGEGADGPIAPTSARDECMEGTRLPAAHSACTAAVCADHPGCCALAWDQLCVQAVELEPACARSCSGALYTTHGGGVAIVPADGSTAWAQQDVGSGDTYHAAPADLDDDGDVDLAYVTIDSWGLRRNDGGSLVRIDGGPIERYLGRYAVWGDWDRDGDLDLAISGRRSLAAQDDPAQSLWLAFNDGGRLTLQSQPVYTGDEILQLERGDLDGDGDLDLVGGTYRGDGNGIFFLNDGQGHFTRRPNTTIFITEGVRLCQLAGDPLPELIVSGSGYLRVYPNQAGTFVSDLLLSVNDIDFVETHCADLDADGDLDLVASGWNRGPIRVFRNDGGSFSTTPAFWVDTMIASWALDAGDVDGDHDLDLLVQGEGGPRLYRNTTASPTAPITFAEPVQLSITGGFNHHGLKLGPRPQAR